MRVDAVVLDIDGVLVDVADSYRRAIIETVEHLYGATIDQNAIQAFKNAGRFNNDWEVTDAAALFVLAQQAGFQQDITAFTEAIEARGGGLEAARAVLREHGIDVEDAWDPDAIRTVFQQLYLGSERYEDLEGREATLDASGYITDEPVLISQETISALTSEFAVGVLTGRPGGEAQIALDRVGLSLPTQYVITMGSPVPEKPEPDGLLTLTDRLRASAVAFVGDTLDDVATVLAARRVDDRSYYGIGVLTGGLTGSRGRELYSEAGADAVVSSVNEVPALLTRP